jgi:hypothetical protein
VYWFNNMHGRNNVKLAMFTAICNFRIAKQRKKCKNTKEFRCKKGGYVSGGDVLIIFFTYLSAYNLFLKSQFALQNRVRYVAGNIWEGVRRGRVGVVIWSILWGHRRKFRCLTVLRVRGSLSLVDRWYRCNICGKDRGKCVMRPVRMWLVS